MQDPSGVIICRQESLHEQSMSVRKCTQFSRGVFLLLLLLFSAKTKSISLIKQPKVCQTDRPRLPPFTHDGILPLQFFLNLRQDPPPLEAILVIFGRRALIFFLFESSWKKWKMTPLWCACAVVITLETQKCRKRAPRSVEFNFFINCDRHKRFSQNERRRIDLQNVASDFLIFCLGT